MWTIIKSPTVTMSQQSKLNCPICNVSCHIITVHGTNGQERKCSLAKAPFAPLSMQPEPPHTQTNSAPGQSGYTVPETLSLPEQSKLPNPTTDENGDKLILSSHP